MLMLFFLKKVMYWVFLLMVSVTPGYAQMKEAASPAIVINLPSCMLELYSGNTFIKEYPIAIGKPSTPTPIGQFAVIHKEINPIWVPLGLGYSVASGPDNPLGYRWIEFLELYGIHGTNAPWSIGQAVSNGCIRMQEENVEELFEIVQYGTPIKITYERIKTRVNKDGQATVGIYPDIYGLKVITLADVNEKIYKMGLQRTVSDEFLLGLIREAAGQQVPFAQVYKIQVNDTLLPEWAIMIDGIAYVPVRPLAKALNSTITWDEKTQMLRNDKGITNISTFVINNQPYIQITKINEYFNADVYWDKEKNNIEITYSNQSI